MLCAEDPLPFVAFLGDICDTFDGLLLVEIDLPQSSIINNLTFFQSSLALQLPNSESGDKSKYACAIVNLARKTMSPSEFFERDQRRAKIEELNMN